MDKNKELVEKIKAHRGEIRAGVLAKNSVIYISVTKKAVFDMIAFYDDINKYLTFDFVTDGDYTVLYIDNQSE
ncbi:hypothetical protein Ab1vBOLIVR5_gp67c [Agrobacterium phage OLIVR5]|uniref:Uncharacterized protein n=1 Tax=Agrobacterium phage OLIVR5 TaxID=2723773 RepID=A0A858MYT9_9CAUD|nr:hypothetical protein KNU99_gp067 [Agrobacterium phage OLIVR5]QIW87715.1 hypothetical protein Ab1vBOLIVR5_gp67c [Agrobacterium phage OLIVR5]QIW87977.1 hypothetical protein Ab1vBOLIVR6_gp70c [Agrobacterium phage OLIVR6]